MKESKYYIQSFKANNCVDKGISVGEASNAKFNNIDINNATIGFVAKDSSILTIEKGNVLGYETCAAGYRKKQEFLGSIIYATKNICPEKEILIQKNSHYLVK